MMCTYVVTMSTGLWQKCLSHISLFLGITCWKDISFVFKYYYCDVYLYAAVLTSWLLYKISLTCSGSSPKHKSINAYLPRTRSASGVYVIGCP